METYKATFLFRFRPDTTEKEKKKILRAMRNGLADTIADDYDLDAVWRFEAEKDED